VRRLLSQLEVLKSNPQIGRMVPEQQNSAVREIFFGNYRIVYRLRNDIVELLMVRHAARLR
jgi:plasmid stabilization system protein ParE